MESLNNSKFQKISNTEMKNIKGGKWQYVGTSHTDNRDGMTWNTDYWENRILGIKINSDSVTTKD